MPRQLKIISGGQTGADRAALDAAIDLGLDYGGALPKGRLTEDGPLDPKYEKMTELKSKNYHVRTEKNVVDSDATLIFTMGRLGGGSALTMRLAKQHNKPYLHIDLDEKTADEAIQDIRKWLDKMRPDVLNVAGSRESSSVGIYDRVYDILKKTLRDH